VHVKVSTLQTGEASVLVDIGQPHHDDLGEREREQDREKEREREREESPPPITIFVQELLSDGTVMMMTHL
jgi:hypothetical protein